MYNCYTHNSNNVKFVRTILVLQILLAILNYCCNKFVASTDFVKMALLNVTHFKQ